MALLRRQKGAQGGFFPGFTDVVEIGIGSLATVYRARELETHRLVALKLLNVRDASPRALESFERESIALGAVSSHPNIVTLYRSFRAADDRPVLVLELCHGAISDRLRTGSGLPVGEVVALGVKVAGALETAHRAQILHRDVKPQNILISEFGEPALADFGVAMLQSSTQTTAGLFDFTTLHAAPELLEGGETSAATDVYELASSLYQLIAGRSAFRAYDGESPASVILRILRDPVQPLTAALVPTQLSDLLIHAMSKDKAARPRTAAEFAAELGKIEAEQGWPRTPFLVRDPHPAGPAIAPATLQPKNAPPVGLAAPAEPIVVAPAGSPAESPTEYPIAPATRASIEPAADPVPTWAQRAPGAGAQVVGDLSLDPMALRRRVTLRAGSSGLAVDESGLVLRQWWRRQQIPWSDVVGFEPRFDGGRSAGGAGGGRLVALTRTGAVELPATKRTIVDLRYVHALLDAYKLRAQILDQQT